MRHRRIEQGVAGPGVEGQRQALLIVDSGGRKVTLPMPPIFWTARHFVRVTEQQPIGVGRQRRALPTDGDVARAEIVDAGDAGALGEDRAFAQLQRRVCRSIGAHLMPDGLPVRADQVDVCGGQPASAISSSVDSGEGFADVGIQACDFIDAPGFRREGVEDALAQRRIVGFGESVDDLRTDGGGAPSISQSTVSMPSADVPEISPMTSISVLYADLCRFLDTV